ncbi:MAG: hypothetical protein ABH864_02810 [archaeon]
MKITKKLKTAGLAVVLASVGLYAYYSGGKIGGWDISRRSQNVKTYLEEFEDSSEKIGERDLTIDSGNSQTTEVISRAPSSSIDDTIFGEAPASQQTSSPDSEGDDTFMREREEIKKEFAALGRAYGLYLKSGDVNPRETNRLAAINNNLNRRLNELLSRELDYREAMPAPENTLENKIGSPTTQNSIVAEVSKEGEFLKEDGTQDAGEDSLVKKIRKLGEGYAEISRINRETTHTYQKAILSLEEAFNNRCAGRGLSGLVKMTDLLRDPEKYNGKTIKTEALPTGRMFVLNGGNDSCLYFTVDDGLPANGAEVLIVTFEGNREDVYNTTRELFSETVDGDAESVVITGEFSYDKSGHARAKKQDEFRDGKFCWQPPSSYFTFSDAMVDVPNLVKGKPDKFVELRGKNVVDVPQTEVVGRILTGRNYCFRVVKLRDLAATPDLYDGQYVAFNSSDKHQVHLRREIRGGKRMGEFYGGFVEFKPQYGREGIRFLDVPKQN